LRADVIKDRPVRAPDLKHVPEALRHEHPHFRPFTFEHSVGANGDAMHQPLDRAEVELHGRQHIENGARGIVGCR
jgi:hypothetical protein